MKKILTFVFVLCGMTGVCPFCLYAQAVDPNIPIENTMNGNESEVETEYLVDSIIAEVTSMVNVPSAQLAQVPFSEVVNRRLSGMNTNRQFLQQPMLPVPQPVKIPKVPQVPQHLKHRAIHKAPVIPTAPKTPVRIRPVQLVVPSPPPRLPRKPPKLPPQPRRKQ